MMGNVSKCFFCANKKDYDAKFGYFGCAYSGQECKEYSMFEPKVNPKTRTNYAKLRALDEEGLAAFLAIITAGDRSDRARWLKWLKQEASI